MNPTAQREYIARLPFTQAFDSLSPDVQDKLLFGASEALRYKFGAAVLTDELVALQAIYMAEGEAEEFAKFKRQNVTSMRVEDLQFSFEKGATANIAPAVLTILERNEEEAKAAESAPIFGSWF